MSSIRREQFLLQSTFDGGNFSNTQDLDIRIPHMSGIAPLVFRVQVRAAPGLNHPEDIPNHIVLIQKDPMYFLAAAQVQARVTLRSRPGNANAQPQFLNALTFESNTSGDTYRVTSVHDGVFYHSQPEGTIETHDKADETLGYQVYREGDTRVFAVRTHEGTNKIVLPSDLWPFVSRINEQRKQVLAQSDLAEAVEFSTYN